MIENFVFYGSLKDQSLLERKFNISVVESKQGFIKGVLYKLYDPTEPNGVFSYPLLDVSQNGFVSAMLSGIDFRKQCRENFIEMILEYEGPLFSLAKVNFCDLSLVKYAALAFIWDKKKSLPSGVISKLQPDQFGRYNWNNDLSE